MNASITTHKLTDTEYIFRRSVAYFVDVSILMVAVQGFQWGLSFLTGGFPFNWLAEQNNGWFIYGWIFCTVSLPIWLYFIVLERSGRQATPGKRLLGVHVVSTTGEKAGWGQAVGRTALKLVPWEIYHLTFMLPVPLLSDPAPAFRPGFVIGGVVLLLFILVLLRSPHRQSIHDIVAGTRVVGT